MLRNFWQAQHGSADTAFNTWWDDTLRHGFIADSAALPRTPEINWDAVVSAYTSLLAHTEHAPVEIVFAHSAAVYDGRFANNPWLQEFPDPVTKLTWDNAALLSPAFAHQLGVHQGDVVAIHGHGRTIQIPVLPVPGHADHTISLPLGYGRTGSETVARNVGTNVNVLRTTSAPFIDPSLSITPTNRQVALAITQAHWTLHGRRSEIVQEVVAGKTLTPPSSRKRKPLTLYEPPTPSPNGFGADQWAMVIDLDNCTGCGACVIACQAENNIPVVGKEGVAQSREMHWMRIDRYLDDSPNNPNVVSQPMLCQHCEKAPCEYVCPVGATMHSDDGLNEMIYNRCVGTRFCSNNCPYKVRRFNWFDYNDELAETERMAKNPDVTVRARGVMEKCTFCVQRIREAQINAELQNAPRTGPVVTACQQTCPTHAITFGSLTDPSSAISQLRNDPRSFAVLDHLATEPRVRYLARVRTTQPALSTRAPTSTETTPGVTPEASPETSPAPRSAFAPEQDNAVGTLPSHGSLSPAEGDHA
jgi:molybdopterin-containing oxidoreductase family iron-sulfur binding subunit